MRLRKHQQTCIDNIDEHFKTDNNALIKMFCGAKKSFIVYECLLKYEKTNRWFHLHVINDKS